jgi:hypothetical protein
LHPKIRGSEVIGAERISTLWLDITDKHEKYILKKIQLFPELFICKKGIMP